MRLTGNSGGTDASVATYAQDGLGSVVALIGTGTAANQSTQAGNTLSTTGDYDSSGYPNAQLKDGLTTPSGSSGWVGVIGSGAAVTVTLASASALDRVDLYATPGYLPGSYVVELLQSGSWVAVASGSSADFSAQADGSQKASKSFTAQSANGLRVRFTASSTGFVWLTELQVWSAGASAITQKFDAWGQLLSATGSIPTYGYTGREPDASGLTFYRARYYHPGLGQFISRDPMGMADAVSPYAYVGGNPVNFTDPSGMLAASPKAAQASQSYWGSITSSVSNFVSGLDIGGTLDQFGHKLAYDFVQNNQGRAGDPSAQGWLADKLAPYAKGYDGSTANGQAAGAMAIGATLITPGGAVKEVKIVKRGGETAATIAGREAHVNYANTLGGGYEFNRPLASGKRPDAIDEVNNIVRELKPDTPSGISRGLKQLQGYVDELEKTTKQKWQGFLDTYNKR